MWDVLGSLSRHDQQVGTSLLRPAPFLASMPSRVFQLPLGQFVLEFCFHGDPERSVFTADFDQEVDTLFFRFSDHGIRSECWLDRGADVTQPAGRAVKSHATMRTHLECAARKEVGEASGDLRLQIIHPLARILSKAVILAIQPELLG